MPDRRLVALALALLLVGAGCSQPTPVPKNLATAPAANPRAALPSPSPSTSAVLASPGASASPSPILRPPTPSGTATPMALGKLPFAVVIDNIVEARPQVGLAEANVVYEAPAEGGIPRLMAVYLQDGPARIGPVRSARHYFVELAQEFGAALVHIGASPQGFAMLSRLGTVRVDESRGDGGFTRDPKLLAPHNAFVSAGGVREHLEANGVTLKATTAGFGFGRPKESNTPGSHLRIAYPGGTHYVVQYDYHSETGTYGRMMDGRPHVDGITGTQYEARSVIVEFARVTAIPNDDAGRLDIGLVGAGDGVVFYDGSLTKVRWTKENDFQPTRFKLEDGSPLILPGGQVWVQIVPTGTSVEMG